MSPAFPEDEVDELRKLCPDLHYAEEAGEPFFLLPQMKLGPHCVPNVVDLLFAPLPREGYMSRLYFAQRIDGPSVANWTERRILGRSWHAFSWNGIDRTDRLVAMVAAHLRPMLGGAS